MTTNPFETPKASLDVPATMETANPAIDKKIKSAWVAGLISAGVTLALILISFTGTSIGGVDAWALIDLFIILGLSYGVFRKSRTCAVLLLLVFVANKLLMWATAGNVSGLPLALIFIWFFGQGVVGTFQHHKARKVEQVAS